MRRRGGRLAVAASLAGCCAGLLLTGCGSVRAGDEGDTIPTKPGFVRHTGAVQYPSVSDAHDDGYVAPGQGLRQLVPLGNCALGVGTFANGYGYVNVNWSGPEGCTRLTLAQQPQPDDEDDKPYSMRTGWPGGGLPADVVVPWSDGSLIGVSGGLTRQSPGGGQTPLAKLPLNFNPHPEHETDDDASVNAAAKVGDRLLIGGGQYVNQVESPYVFASDDAGRTVRRVALPTVDGLQPPTPVGAFGVHGTQVVALGAAATNAYDFHAAVGTLPFWFSGDGGTHWTAGDVTGTPPGTQVHSVLYASGRWYAVGGYAKAGALYDSLPLVLTSQDGTHWTRADSKAMGTGEITAATVDASGHAVLVGSASQSTSKPDTRPVRCSSTWLADGTAKTADWRRDSLGCAADPPTAVVTLKDGRVLIAGNRDLWIRAAKAPGGVAHR